MMNILMGWMIGWAIGCLLCIFGMLLYLIYPYIVDFADWLVDKVIR